MRIKEIPKEDALQAMAARYPELDVKSVQSMLWIFRFSAELEKALETHFARKGISRGRFLALVTLYKQNNHEMSPSELAEILDVTRGNMTGLIDTLEKDHFVERIANKEDRRCFTIKLSKKGANFLEKLLPDYFKRISKTFKGISTKEQTHLIDLLQQLEKSLTHIRSD